MRLLSLFIALAVLAGVAYVSLSTPSRAAVFGDDGKASVAAPAH